MPVSQQAQFLDVPWQCMPHLFLNVVLCRLQVAGITEEAALYDQHQAAKAAALAVFVDAAMGEPELVKEFEKRLEKGGRASAAQLVTLIEFTAGIKAKIHFFIYLRFF